MSTRTQLNTRAHPHAARRSPVVFGLKAAGASPFHLPIQSWLYAASSSSSRTTPDGAPPHTIPPSASRCSGQTRLNRESRRGGAATEEEARASHRAGAAPGTRAVTPVVGEDTATWSAWRTACAQYVVAGRMVAACWPCSSGVRHASFRILKLHSVTVRDDSIRSRFFGRLSSDHHTPAQR